ncbi:MAG: hypothetical protein L0H63_15870 [Nitrococcus sp.]|nr:hypothetical protein [Nitrococcus sp.]
MSLTRNEQPSALVRKQYYVSRAHVAKLERLARRAGPGVTAADVVRRSIDAYDPDRDEPSDDELGAALRAASEAVDRTIGRVREVRERVRQARADEVDRETVLREVHAWAESSPAEFERLVELFRARR